MTFGTYAHKPQDYACHITHPGQKETLMVIQILSHTPAWVFALFVFLIMLGVRQNRARIVQALVRFLLPFAPGR